MIDEPLPEFKEPNERDYAVALKALSICMLKFGPEPAIRTIDAFQRRQSAIKDLKRNLEL